MTATTYTETTTLVKITCTCGILFAAPQAWYNQKKTDGTGFHCPNGHPLVFRKTPESELREKIAQAERDARFEKQMRGWAEERADSALKRAEQERMGRLGERSAKNRLQKRIGHGYCPCCTRRFSNLESHMAQKHPDFKDGDNSVIPQVRLGRPPGSKNKAK